MRPPLRIAALALLTACGAASEPSIGAEAPAAQAERTAESDLDGLRARIVGTGTLRRQCPGYVKDPVPGEEIAAGRAPKGQLGFRAGPRAGETGVTPALGRCRLDAPCSGAEPFRESPGWRALEFDPSASGSFPYTNSYAYAWSVDDEGVCTMRLSAWSPDENGTYTRRTQTGTMRDGKVAWDALQIRRAVRAPDP